MPFEQGEAIPFVQPDPPGSGFFPGEVSVAAGGLTQALDLTRIVEATMQWVIVLVLAALSFDATADAKAGEKKAQVCLLCHKPMAGHALLEAQPAKYLVAAITAYKTGKRADPVMQTNVARLSARDISDIADYFVSKAPVSSCQTADAAKVTAGETRAKELQCAKCHQATYSGIDVIPRLAGQSTGYLIARLEAFASGRSMHPSTDMPSTGVDIESVASYLSSVR